VTLKHTKHPLPEQNKKVIRKISPHSTIKTIPSNYEEFRIHPFKGAVVGRCLAKSRRTGMQFGAFAVTGYAVCFHHGGSRSSGKRSILGEKARYDSILKHGNRSAPVIKRRTQKYQELAAIKNIARAIGLLPK
jgi:hypothetical protein